MSNQRNGTLYTGVTSNLIKRIYQHKEALIKGFATKYGCKNLVYYEVLQSMEQAILREKEIKLFRRSKKLDLIESLNPNWEDLYYIISRI